MAFGILGPVQAWSADGTVVSVGGPRVRALLAMLLLDAGRIVSTDRLLAGLYGDNPPTGSANALQSQVSRLRRALAEAEAAGVEFHPAGYRLTVRPDEVDAHRFTRLAQEGRAALAAGDARGARQLLDEALALWRGRMLADIVDVPFAPVVAARWEEMRLAAFEDRTEALLEHGEYDHTGLVADLREAIAAHPLRERLRGQLMRALYGAGRPAEALAVFNEARHVLADELGTDPSPQLTAVHVAILRAEPPPATTNASAVVLRGSGLPAQLSTFVGRDEELRRIGKLLDAGRLVTVTGPGGAGKTRLAIEVGEHEMTRHRAEPPTTPPVSFVDISAIGSGSELAQAVLAALGLRESGLLHLAAGRPDFEGRLIAALVDREVLLILDNCEHVIADAARLTHLLLSACPKLRILATSREPLAITGEALWPLAPLALPPEGTPSQQAVLFSAVRLFADRAGAANPGFILDDTNSDAVTRICGALDGLPLAIELAAARLRSLSVADIAARLHDRFRLLSRGSRTAAPRHQTLWSVVEWSWDLLSPAERTLARRLTVFAGGATIDAATAVCGHEYGPSDVDDLLAALADKSLVETSAGRYRMLDTIRVFCAAQLAEAGEQEAMSAAHAAYFLDLAQTGDERLRGREQLNWLATLTAEQANLQSALRWSVQHDPGTGLRLVAALSFYWLMRGLRSEAAPLADKLLKAIEYEPPPGLAEEYAMCVLNVAAAGMLDESLAPLLRRCRDIVTGLDWSPRYPFGMVMLAQVVGFQGDERHDMRIPEGADAWLIALSNIGQGFWDFYTGQMDDAERDFSQALEGFRRLDERWGMAAALDTLSALASWRGDQQRSLALVDEALSLIGPLGALEDMSTLWARQADFQLRGGDRDGARAKYARAAELGRQAGAAEAIAGAYLGLGEIARLDGDLAEAMRLYDIADRRLDVSWTAGEMRWRLLVARGRIAEARGDADTARENHRVALGRALSVHNFLVAAHASEGLAGVAVLEGDAERAAQLLGLAVTLRGIAIADDPDVARIALRVRELAGADTYDREYAQATRRTRDEAIALLTA